MQQNIELVARILEFYTDAATPTFATKYEILAADAIKKGNYHESAVDHAILQMHDAGLLRGIPSHDYAGNAIPDVVGIVVVNDHPKLDRAWLRLTDTGYKFAASLKDTKIKGKVQEALSWGLSSAVNIGVTLGTEALKAQLGLP